MEHEHDHVGVDGRTQRHQDPAQPAPRSPAEELQQAGNHRLVEARQALQRQEAPAWSSADGTAPDWIIDELGVRSAVEASNQADRKSEEAMDKLPSSGPPLPGGVQRQAEAALGVPLGDVRVAERADQSTGPVQAQAFTTRNDTGGHLVALSSGVDLSTPDGQFTLLHELSHVAQQRDGQADGLHGLDGDPAQREHLEQDADARAARALQGEPFASQEEETRP